MFCTAALAAVFVVVVVLAHVLAVRFNSRA
jgi:hypothetical protein